jgi:PKD repeat protein
MRSIPLLAATTVILAAVSACGGDGGVGPNTPAANFTQQCTGLACTFNDASTPTGQISSWAWDFGDPNSGATNNASTAQNPTHTFSAPNTYQVKLTVTNASGATNSRTTAVTVTAPANQPPTASFDLPTSCTAGTPCGFHSTSTDPDGDIALATFRWDFGDQGTGDTPDATHTYNTAGTYTVTLTVTDEDGATSTPATQQLTVSPRASQSCTTSGNVVDCSLGLTQRVTVKITIVSEDCQLSGNKLTITIPPQPEQTAFFNLCNRAVGEEYIVKDAAGAPLVFQPGSTLPLRFHQGPQGTNPPVSDPGIRVTGNYPIWTLNIDDGGAAGTPGEPDFNDVVLNVQATTAP